MRGRPESEHTIFELVKKIGSPEIQAAIQTAVLKPLKTQVEKIIKPLEPGEPEKAQINIEGADDMYREIRIENSLTTEDGKQARLRKGTEVDVTVEADREAINPKNK